MTAAAAGGCPLTSPADCSAFRSAGTGCFRSNVWKLTLRFGLLLFELLPVVSVEPSLTKGLDTLPSPVADTLLSPGDGVIERALS